MTALERSEALKREQSAAWLAEVRADHALGGAKFDETKQLIAKGATLASPELLQMLKASGFGNHPEVIRLFRNIGSRLSEDGFVNGSQSAFSDVPLENRLYPNEAQRR
jgi:hypothetical protein